MKEKKSKLREKMDTQLFTMTLLPLAKIFLFAYLPLLGILMAFENYDPNTLFFSEWAGFDNFKFIFSSPDLFRLIRNALILNLLYMVLGTAAGVALALLMFEITRRVYLRSLQTVFFFPYFIAWPLVGLLLISIIGTNGFFTQFLSSAFGLDVNFYAKSSWWPVILTVENIWKNAGITAIGYFAVLLGIDQSVFEAADIDGANRWQKMFRISLPYLKYMVVIGLITISGNILRTDFSMVYYSVGSQTQLYEFTDVLETFMFRALSNSSTFGQTVAMSVFQGSVGLVLSVVANHCVTRIDKEAALF